MVRARLLVAHKQLLRLFKYQKQKYFSCSAQSKGNERLVACYTHEIVTCDKAIEVKIKLDNIYR